jgi:hypothetical protein
VIEQNQVYAIEFSNLRRVHKNRACGEIFCIELEITENEWHYLSDFPQDAIGNVALQWTERATMEPSKPKREPKPAKQPAPYGQFWRELDRSGFHNRPDIRQWIDYDGMDEGEAKERIRQVLGVGKRSMEASPEVLIAALRKYDNSWGAITAVEQAKRRSEQYLREAA